MIRPAILFALLANTLAAEPRFVVGVCTHFQQNKGILDANLSLIRQSGVASIRDEASWSGVERQQGQFAMPEAWDTYVTHAVKAGIDPLIVLDYGNRFYDNGDKPLSDAAVEGFARYAEFVVRHFQGKVKMYEIWNEWDIAIGHTTPGAAEAYAKLLKTVYPRIKAIDRSARVLGGAATTGGIRKGWLEGMLAAGALGSLDAVSIHTYNYGGQGRARTPEDWADFVAGVEAGIHKFSDGRDVPIYVTEMGWPTHTGARSTTPAQSAAYLARMFLLARTLPYLKGIWWYDFQDDGWKADYNENNFGMVRPDLTPKPSYYALASLAALIAEGEFVAQPETGDPELRALKFRRPDGRETLAVWSTGGPDRPVIVATGAHNPGAARIAEAGRVAVEIPWGLRDWARQPRAETAANRLSVVIGETPTLITGESLSLVAAK